ncbi:7tm Odorant receptor [Popillia japonica]|uniref:7tm Odorant receptor n=1 Tax=Popillia japonica TaxID=7064 RepID=A0AAW1MKJ6_POPJA
MIIQIAIFCWFGETLIAKSSMIADACYKSKWYQYSPNARKTIILVMQVAQRNTAFKAGGFFQMSLLTFVMILRSAYSYFTVLLNSNAF